MFQYDSGYFAVNKNLSIKLTVFTVMTCMTNFQCSTSEFGFSYLAN